MVLIYHYLPFILPSFYPGGLAMQCKSGTPPVADPAPASPTCASLAKQPKKQPKPVGGLKSNERERQSQGFQGTGGRGGHENKTDGILFDLRNAMTDVTCLFLSTEPASRSNLK